MLRLAAYPPRLRLPLMSNVRPLAMARNIEIEARIASVEALLPRVAALASEGPIAIVQKDTFFQCESWSPQPRGWHSRGVQAHGQAASSRMTCWSEPMSSFWPRRHPTLPSRGLPKACFAASGPRLLGAFDGMCTGPALPARRNWQ